MKLRDSKVQRLTRPGHHLLHRELKAVGVPFLAGERAKLAAQNAIVGIIDIAVDDVARAVAHFSLPHEICNRAHRIQVFALEQPQGIGLANALPRDDLVVDVAQLAALQKKTHCTRNPPRKTTSETVTIRNTTLISALRRKNAR